MREPGVRLDVRLQHHIGALLVDVRFELTRPWTILFGPSGSGKSTILRSIAGMLRPEAGRIVLSTDAAHGEDLVLVDTEAGIFVPPHTRRIPLAPQRATLFPHQTVLENVRYGVTRNRHMRDEEFDALLREMQIDQLAGKYPAELSGGEAQRVNLARAVAASGELLLLDEPFTGLDAPLRERLQSALKTISQTCGVPILSVTHDIAEPFQVGAEVIRLDQGRIVRRGPAEEVLSEERDRLLQVLRKGRTTNLRQS